VLAGSAAALAAGASLGLALYPWTDVPVLGFAIAGGVLLGRSIPPRPVRMFILLGALAALDAIQIVVQGPGPGPRSTNGTPPAWYFYVTLVMNTAWFATAFGIFDVLVIAAVAEHARRRGLPFAVGAAPGVIAFVAAGLAVLILGPLTLPLIPFLLGGWLVTESAVLGVPILEDRAP
jgi:hypothetical protein